MKTTVALVVTLVVALALAACGDGGGETTAATTTTPTTGDAAAKPQAQSGGHESQSQQGKGATRRGHSAPGDTSASFTPPAHHDSQTGAAAFEVKGGDNSIQEFGAEASEAEFQQAASALHGYLDARAAGAWSAACSYLLPDVSVSLAELGGEEGRSCPKALASLSAGISPADLREAAEVEVAALRTEGDHGFLLVHGAAGVDYFMPMAGEGGDWKVAAIAPSAIA